MKFGDNESGHTDKEEKQRHPFEAWTMIQKDNIHESKEIVTLCKEMDFDNLTFQVYLTAWGKDDWRDRNQGFKSSFTEENMD